MNTLIDKKELAECCKELIGEFDLNLTEPYPGTFLLKGTFCNIRFTWDRGEVACFLVPVTNEFELGYNVMFVYKYLSPAKPDPKSFIATDGDWGSTIDQIQNRVDMIQSGLRHVLKGDFNWVNGYLSKG